MSKSNQNAAVDTAVDTAAAIDAAIAALETTSAKIRYLTSQGWKRGDIAKKLDIRYQHVRNVQLQPLKRIELK